MAEIETPLRDELERLAPPDDTVACWPEVVRRARTRHRHAARTAILAGLVLVAAIAPALALSAGVRSLLGFQPPLRPVVQDARLLVSAPVEGHRIARMWQAPAAPKGRCLLVEVDPAGSPARADGLKVGGGCGPAASFGWATTRRHPIGVSFQMATRRSSDEVPPIVSGGLLRDLPAGSVALVWTGGSKPLALRGRYFIGSGPALYAPPFGRLPFYVVVYDRAGRKVACKKLDSPSLYPVPKRRIQPQLVRWKRTHPRAWRHRLQLTCGRFSG
jgi:hypothetical protein